jgi:hypothetical protein
MSVKEHKTKSADQLAWDFIESEIQRQFHEPLATLERLAGEPPTGSRNN